MVDPISAADAEGLALARGLMRLRHAALAVIDAETGTPGISRIALGIGPAGEPVTLISQLASHFSALKLNPACALLVGEPGSKGDPLTHPRLMIRANADFVAPEERADLRSLWLADHPKSKLYVDFADFGFVRFRPLSILLNAGFGRAMRVDPFDLIGK